MADGFAVVGLVLALYPMVVDAWEAYKAAKSGAKTEQIVQRLRTEQIIYNEFVQYLVGSSVSEAQRARLNATSPPGEEGFWSDPGLQEDLKRRFGFEKMETILKVVVNMHTLLVTIGQDLPGVGRSFSRIHVSPLARLHPGKYLSPTPLGKNLGQLRDYNRDLERLLGVRTLQDRGANRRKRPATVRFLRQTFTHASDIYNAICQGYKCNCVRPHFANLKLPRIDNRQTETNGGRDDSEEPLQLLFAIDDIDGTTSPESAVRATIQSQQNSATIPPSDIEDKLAQPEFWTSTTIDGEGTRLGAWTIDSRKRRTSEISICECLDEPIGDSDDLCEFTRTCGSKPDAGSTFREQESAILYSVGKKYKLHAPHTPSDVSNASAPVVSLHNLLNDQSTRKRQRMRLALELSFAILQYYSTGWINPSWTWKDFSIAGITGDPSESQLFVTTKFYSVLKVSTTEPMPRCTFASEIWTAVGEPILTRLGFALIELAMGQPLSQLRDESMDPTSMDLDTRDYFTARNILTTGKLADEEGSVYEAVVRACLDHQFYCQTRYKTLDSRQSSFHQDVEECVIAPLHSMWIDHWE